MDKFNITIWDGETTPIQVEWATDITAQARLTVIQGGAEVYTNTQNFADNFVDLSIPPNTLNVGSYNYLIYVEYPSGEIDALPDTCCADGTCAMPTITVCEVVDAS